jgi:hypothetical protein
MINGFVELNGSAGVMLGMLSVTYGIQALEVPIWLFNVSVDTIVAIVSTGPGGRGESESR